MDDKQFDKIFNEKLDELNVDYDKQAYQDFLVRQNSIGTGTYGSWQKWIMGGVIAILASLSLFLYDKNSKLNTRVQKLQSEYASTISMHSVPVIDTVTVMDTMVVRKYQYSQLRMTIADVTEWLQQDNSGARMNQLLSSTNFSSENEFIPISQSMASSKPEMVNNTVPDWWEKDWTTHLTIGPHNTSKIITPRKRYNPLKINAGLSASVNIPYADRGATFLNNSFQINFELFKNDRHRLFTGLTYGNINYLLEGTSDRDKYSQSDLQNFPDLQDEGFLPRRITVSNQLWSLPINYRFYNYLTNQWGLYIGGGLQMNLLNSQSFYYDYLEIQEGELLEFDKTIAEEQNQFSIGYLNATFGLVYDINYRFNFNADVNYFYNLSPLGIESRRLHQLGFQAGLQYRLRQ